MNEDSLFFQQEMELARFTDDRTEQLLKYLEQARKEMLAVIAEPDTYTAKRVESIVRQLDEIRDSLNKDVVSVGDSSESLGKMAKAHLEQSGSLISGRSITLAFDKINPDILSKFSQSELNHCTTLTNTQIQRVKSILFTKVGVKGENPARVARYLAGKDSTFAKLAGTLDNIMRTETSSIYNAQANEGIKEINSNYDLSLNKRIVETIDLKRNHPISLLVNNQVQKSEEPFKVAVKAVAAKAAELKKGSGGVLWEIIGENYVGQRLPAHFRERGVMVPTEREVTQ